MPPGESWLPQEAMIGNGGSLEDVTKAPPKGVEHGHPHELGADEESWLPQEAMIGNGGSLEDVTKAPPKGVEHGHPHELGAE